MVMSYHSDQIKSAIGISAIVSVYGVVSILVWLIGPSLGLSQAYTIIHRPAFADLAVRHVDQSIPQ